MGKKQMIEILKRLWADEGSGFTHSKAEIAKFLKFAAECNPIAGSSLHWDALSSDYTHIVRSLTTNTLLMVGDSTLGASSIYQRMGAAVPAHGAHFAVIPGGTHCPHLQPELLPEMIRLVQQLLNGSLEVNASPGCLLGPNRPHAAARQPLGVNSSLNAIAPIILGQKPSQQKHASVAHHTQTASFLPPRQPAATKGIMMPLRTASFLPSPRQPAAMRRFMGA